MRITMGDHLALSEAYPSQDALLAAYREAEAKEGHEVPYYDLGALLIAAGLWVLGVAVEKTIHYFTLDAEKRVEHREVVAELHAIKKVLADARQKARDDDDLADAGHQGGGHIRVRIELETETEGDLAKAFDSVAQKLPNLSIAVNRSQ